MAQHYVAKTIDGGRSWKELPVASDGADREFGVGFVTPEIGWIGTLKGGYRTLDGGANWTFVEMGRAVNKIRVMPTAKDFVGFAIGVEVRKIAIGT